MACGEWRRARDGSGLALGDAGGVSQAPAAVVVVHTGGPCVPRAVAPLTQASASMSFIMATIGRV